MIRFLASLLAVSATLFLPSCDKNASEEERWFEMPVSLVDGTTVTLNCLTHLADAVVTASTKGFAYAPITADGIGTFVEVRSSVTFRDHTISCTLEQLLPETEYLYYVFVDTGAKRFEGDRTTFTTGAGEMPDPERPALTEYTEWAELPAVDQASEELYSVAHFCPGLPGGRNYSACYDAGRRSGLWVAFPLHDCYEGDQDRTDAWAYDPEIPYSVQPNLVSGSYQPQIGYSRGHLLASSDRTFSRTANEQTFYVTNMAPQWQNSFNGGVWSSLETDCWKNVCADTLYVVSGVYFADRATTVTDKDGAECVVPTNFYRVLLRSKDGNTGRPVRELSSDELQCVGFWFENRAYPSGKPSQQMTSVSEIEQKTGLEFFVNVPRAPKEEYDPSAWDFR